MLETLISSRTRIKLLLKFFLNSQSKSYLRNLESEFGESTNAIRLELNKFEEAGMLKSSMEGNKRVFSVNQSHPLFGDIHNMVIKYVGLDKVINTLVRKIGNLSCVYLVGDYAEGKDSGLIDLVLVGHDLDKVYLLKKTAKAEQLVNRKIRFLIFEDIKPLEEYLVNQPHLLLWNS